MDQIATVCTYCGCGCGIYLNTDNGVLAGVMPSTNHPISEGKLCLRGWNAHEIVVTPERISTPLIRKDGDLEEVSWDIAISETAKRLREIKDKYGSQALAVIGSARYTNEENYLLMKFGRGALGTPNVDHGAHLASSASFSALNKAFGLPAMTNSITEIDGADVILVCGANPVEQHPNVAGRIITAVKNGTIVIVVGPRRYQLAKVAQVFLQPNPGTDLAWLMGLANVIVEEGLLDREFIAKHCDGYDEFAAKIKDFTPEHVEKISGIPADDLRRAARIYAKAKNAMIFYSAGIIQHPTGAANILALANLALITGNVGKPSSGVNHLIEHNNGLGACDMGLCPNLLTGCQDASNADVKKKFEAEWRVELPSEEGLPLFEIMSAVDAGETKGMFILGNPFLSNPDVHHLKEALNKLDVLVVQDMFVNDAFDCADIILPGVPWAMKDGTFTNTERRVQRIRKAIEPDEVMPDWQILTTLLKESGMRANYDSPAQIMEEIASLTPIYAGISYEKLERSGGVQWPCTSQDCMGTPYLYKDGFPNGKASLSALEYTSMDEKTDAEYPLVMSIGRSSFYWNESPMTQHASTLRREYGAIFLDYEKGFAEINIDDAKELKVRDGSPIKVKSRRGELQINAMVSPDVKPGHVFIPFFLREQAGFLMEPVFDPESKAPAFRLCAVRIERA